MELPSTDVVSILEELMEECKDGEQGYKNAADDVKDKELASALLSYSEQRGSFVDELRVLIQSLGGATEFTGSIMGILHRRWLDVKFGAAGSNTESILNDCLACDEAAIKKYEIHLKQELPGNVMLILTRQQEAIKDAHSNTLKLMEKHKLRDSKN
jgi:uncharacterized protein (TIGR02284 family)